MLEVRTKKMQIMTLDNVTRGSGSLMRIVGEICGLVSKRGKAIRACSFLCLIICLVTSNVHAASFDCKKAKTKIEKMICSDDEVSKFDEELARVYKKAMALVSYKDQMKKQQQQWIKALRNACEDEFCLRREYRDRIAALNSTLAAAAFKRTPEDPKLERERVIAAAKKLKWEKPYDWKEGDKESNAKRQFCEGLLAALQAGKDVEFVEPIVRTDDYTDPKLQAYLGRCPKLKPIKNVQWLPKVWEMIEAQDIPEEEWDDYGRKYYSSLDFKLYYVDFDGNPENGKEYLFYGGCGYEFGHPGATSFRHYGILDLVRCKELGGIQVLETINYRTRQPTRDTNGVIQYKSRFYVYELRYPDSNNRRIRVHHWDEKSLGKTTTVCWFD